MTKATNQHKFDKEFKVCPDCGYEDGFHNMFRQDGAQIKWLFICPSCHAVFDTGFVLPEGIKKSD